MYNAVSFSCSIAAVACCCRDSRKCKQQCQQANGLCSMKLASVMIHEACAVQAWELRTNTSCIAV
jgi:hypothetical protein